MSQASVEIAKQLIDGLSRGGGGCHTPRRRCLTHRAAPITHTNHPAACPNRAR
jgi:hypothetical protein